MVASGGTGHPAPGVRGVFLSSGAGRSWSSMAARRASSTLRTTRGAFVNLRFVVTVPAGLLPAVSSLRYTRPSCRNGGPILPNPIKGAVRNSRPSADAF